MPELRPYQLAGVEALRSHVRAGRRRVLLCCPVGAGKTEIAGSMVATSTEKFGARVLFFAHRLELVDQPVARFARWGVTDVGVMRGDDTRTNPDALVQIATVQTLGRRSLPPADLVFVDECHRAAGQTYRRILDAYPEATIVGLTATPWRLDGRPLGDVFEAIACVSTYSDLVSGGFISAPTVFSTRVPADLSGVRTRMGDYAEDELGAAMDRPELVGSIVSEWREHAGGRRTVVYACTVAHSKSIVARFIADGVRAEHLDGETPIGERREMLARLDRGELEVVSNCQVLTEGWDQPSAKCIVMARPTKSLSLYIQIVGRALRPWEGVVPIVIDHGGNVDRHGLPHEDREWSLLAGPKKKLTEKNPYHVCPACYAYVSKNPCEVCGHERPKPKPREIPEAAAEKLTERTGGDERRTFFLAQLARAEGRGFKPGFASAKYKEKYGNWPPWSWGQEAKSEFAKNPAWQDRNMRREREKEFWAEQERKGKPEPVPETPEQERKGKPEPVPETPEQEPDFLDWLEGQLH